MNKTQKIILITMIIVLVIIISIIIVILNLRNLGTGNNNGYSEFEETITYVPDSNLQDVQNRNKYFAVKRMVDTYFSYIEQLNGDKKLLYDVDNIGQVRKEQENGAILVLKDLIGEDENKQEYVTEDMLKREGKKYSKDYTTIINSMLITEKTASINVYIIELKVGEVNTKLAVKTDSKDMTFSIFPESYLEKYSYDNDKVVASISEDSIVKNNYNTFNYNNITDMYMAKQYFNDYIYNMKNDIDKAYNMLDEEYVEKRFESIDDYKKYIQARNEKFSDASAQKFQLKKYDDYNQYVLIDQYDNYYIFRETAIMKYSVILDTYTLDDLPEYVERYNKADEQKKTAYCVDRFIKAVNDDNYKFAYSLLADSFKQNYFKTYQSFENYAKKNFAGKPKEAFSGFTNEGNVYNTISVTLSKTEDDVTDALTKKFIVKLGEGTKFELSFNVD